MNCPSSPHGTLQILLMRGLPSCGKTTHAKQLVKQGGVAFEFDEYFYTEVGRDPERYDWSRSGLAAAREWNVERICAAVDSGISPIVIDDDNGLGKTTARCVRYAFERGYQIEFREPQTPWWREIRALLVDKASNEQALFSWAQKLALLNRGTHQVSPRSILRRIDRWRDQISVDEILKRAHSIEFETQRTN